jgi:hypothetical protein
MRDHEWEALREAALRNRTLVHGALPPSVLRPAPPRVLSPFEDGEAMETDVSSIINSSLQDIRSVDTGDEIALSDAGPPDEDHGEMVRRFGLEAVDGGDRWWQRTFPNTAARHSAAPHAGGPPAAGSQHIRRKVREGHHFSECFDHSVTVRHTDQRRHQAVRARFCRLDCADSRVQGTRATQTARRFAARRAGPRRRPPMNTLCILHTKTETHELESPSGQSRSELLAGRRRARQAGF